MTQIVIQPNASLTALAACWFISGVSLVMFLIAAGFAYFGLWLIAPFAGLEVVLLIVVFRSLLKSSRRKELIYIGTNTVRVEVGVDCPECASSFKRAWTQVVLEPSSLKGYPSRLFLRCSGLQVRIGEVLNDDERALLARRLKRLVLENPDMGSI